MAPCLRPNASDNSIDCVVDAAVHPFQISSNNSRHTAARMKCRTTWAQNHVASCTRSALKGLGTALPVRSESIECALSVAANIVSITVAQTFTCFPPMITQAKDTATSVARTAAAEPTAEVVLGAFSRFETVYLGVHLWLMRLLRIRGPFDHPEFPSDARNDGLRMLPLRRSGLWLLTIFIVGAAMLLGCRPPVGREKADQLAETALHEYVRTERPDRHQFGRPEVREQGGKWLYTYEYHGQPNNPSP